MQVRRSGVTYSRYYEGMRAAMEWGVRPDEWWLLDPDVRALMIAVVRTRDSIINVLDEARSREQTVNPVEARIAAIRARSSGRR